MANILIIIPALYCGGGLQKISLQLSQELIKRGHRVVVIDKHDPPYDKFSYLEILPKFEKIASYKTDKHNIDKFLNVIKTYNINLIIYEGFLHETNRFLKVLSNKTSIPFLSVYHSSPDAAMPKGKNSIPPVGIKNKLKKSAYRLYEIYSYYKVRSFLKTPYKFSEKVILLSDSFKDLYFGLTKNKDKLTVIPNFVYSAKIKTERCRKKQLLYVGRLEEDAKRFSRVLKIWENIYDKYPDWKLVVAGEGRERENYEKFVCEKGLKNISFLGHVATPDELYHISSISLMTSDYEGFPLAIIEAMANGCVPIAYNSFKSAKDIIDNEINGLLIEPLDEGTYIEKLTRLMDHCEMLNELSKNAIKKSHSFNPENIIPLWENLIESTLKNYDA